MSYPTNPHFAGFQNPIGEQKRRFTLRFAARHPAGGVARPLLLGHGFTDAGNPPAIGAVVEGTNWARAGDLPFMNNPNARLVVHSMRARKVTAENAGSDIVFSIRRATENGGGAAGVGTTVTLAGAGVGAGATNGSANQGGVVFTRAQDIGVLASDAGTALAGADNVEADLEVEVM